MDEADDAGSAMSARMGLRHGGWIGYTDDVVFIDRDGETIRIEHSNVSQLSLRTVEWDLAVMSVLLIGVGTFVGVTRNPLVGIGFGAVGVWSVYRTYSNRYELIIRVANRPKPLSVHPTDPKKCHDRLVDVIGLQPRTR